MGTWLAGVGAAIVAAVGGRWLYDRLFGPHPKLQLGLRPSGSGTGAIFFGLDIVNTGGRGAINCDVTAALDGIGSIPFRHVRPSRPFDVERRETVEFSIESPTYGDRVPAFGNENETTLYGRTLTVRVRCGRRTWTTTWREDEYDAATNRARYEIQQEIWRTGAVPKND